jgi:Ca2+/Na+ antiporter
MHVVGLMVGTALMFIGFLDVFLSISGGFEINVVPFLIYFGGLAVWANAVIETPVLRYGVMTVAIVLALGFFHYGEVLFWHKQVVFWSTVVIVMYFMFKEPKKPE